VPEIPPVVVDDLDRVGHRQHGYDDGVAGTQPGDHALGDVDGSKRMPVIMDQHV